MDRATIGEIEHAVGDPDFPVRTLMDRLADHGLRVERVSDDLTDGRVGSPGFESDGDYYRRVFGNRPFAPFRRAVVGDE